MMIDLRSDTLTKPTPAMLEVMKNAKVGDDVFNEDPTVNLLQEKIADLLGKEAGLFVASGTMANQIAIKTHTQPGDEIICEKSSHVVVYEAGAPALLSGVQIQSLDGRRGVISPSQIEHVIRPENVHFPPTKLIWIENTHNKAGGTIYPINELSGVSQLAEKYHLKMHLDGARLWNAHAATGIPLADYARFFDSVSVCFSKGLGAPVGSMLAGDHAFICKARRYRKIFGGGMRQVGFIAAGALFAIENHIDRLKEDHLRAKRLAEALEAHPEFSVDIESVQTNIVYFNVQADALTAKFVEEKFSRMGLLVIATGPKQLRAVTHLDVSDTDIDKAIDLINSFSFK